MKILAIDTSCDETSVAVVENDWVIANKLSSQIQSHQEWGGVVPSLAKRKHEELIDLVIDRALKQAQVELKDIDVFAVTRGPGLAIALEVGIRKAREFAKRFNKPLVAVNHMEGHIYSTWAKNSKGLPVSHFQFPVLCLLVSGGHTEFVLMRNHGEYEIIGQTLDDAIGECFDKVGRMLDLGYPAGPVIEKLAESGNETTYKLPIPMQFSKDGNMSYSGLKTAAMKLVNDELKNPLNKYGEKFQKQVQYSSSLNRSQKVTSPFSSLESPSSGFLSHPQEGKLEAPSLEKVADRPEGVLRNDKQVICDICASFQKAAVDQVSIKTEFVIKKLSVDSRLKIEDLIIGGGVAQNKYLRKRFKQKFGNNLRIHYPTAKRLHTDNAGMIGVAAYFNALRENFVKDIDNLDREPNWRIDKTN